MKNEIAPGDVKFKKLVMRDGTTIQLGHSPERLEAIKEIFNTREKGFVEIDGQIINIADVSGIFDDSQKIRSEGCAFFVNEDVTKNIAALDDKYRFMVSTRGGVPLNVNGKELSEILEMLKTNKSGKIIHGYQVVEIMEITGITTFENFTRAAKLRSGYWECDLGNLHERGEKFCDKEQCYLKNSAEYNAIRQKLIDHQVTGNCTLKQNNLGSWHLCEMVQKEYNELKEIEKYARRFRKED